MNGFFSLLCPDKLEVDWGCKSLANPPTSPKNAPSGPMCPVCWTSPRGPEIMSLEIFLREEFLLKLALDKNEPLG